MGRKRRVVAAGYAVGFPLGGQLWMMLHFLLGLRRLGHEVLFLEDTSDWAYPFDPFLGHATEDSTRCRSLAADFLGRHGLAGNWAYVSQIEGRTYGLPREDLLRYLRSADLFLNISGVCPLREEYLAPAVKAVIDTDPVFTQARADTHQWARDYLAAHDVCFTYGVNLPDGDRGAPLCGIDWKPLLPPVVLSEWPVAKGPGHGYTTVGTWETADRDMVVGGRRLSWRKSVKYEAMRELPAKLPGLRLELAMSGMKDAAPRFTASGWSVRDGLELSRDPFAYRDYLQGSRAEFTIAKDQNVVLKSGWFSDRSATYLASGRPVIVEDTGFGEYLPLGEGLFAFEGMDAAEAAIRAVEADPQKAGRAARRIAEEHFDSDIVLSGLLRELDLD